MTRAGKAYADFHGEPATKAHHVVLHEPPDEVWMLGKVIGIAYEAMRDGEIDRYYHEFKPSHAPYLTVSPDGHGLFLADGKYTVTERGIEDK